MQAKAVVVRVRWGDRRLDERVYLGSAAWDGLGIRRQGGEVRVELPEGAVVDGERSSARALALGEGERLVVRSSGLTYELFLADAPAGVEGGLSSEADFHFFKLASCCLLLLAALVAVFLLTPQDEEELSAHGLGRAPAVAKYLPPAKPRPIELTRPGAAARAPGEEGKRGVLEARLEVGGPVVRGPSLAVSRAGLLRAFDELGAGASGVFGGGLGRAIDSALSTLSGGGLMEGLGLGGMGSRGTGPGGGGDRLSLGGGGMRGGGGCCVVPAELGGAHRSAAPPEGPVKVKGGLEREVIARVIRRHQSEMKFCYESELQHRPELAGKVAVMFVIDGAGAVSEAEVAETSLESEAVEACMLRSVRRWKFPEPAGGGVVVVTFPWVFKAAGEDSPTDAP